MNVWELYLMFGLGLVSSLHCLGMCGPLVISYSLPLAGRSYPKQILAHFSYNAGRIITYSALGAAAGLFGGTVGFLGGLAGFENAAAIVAGVLMIVAGVLMLDLVPSKRLQRFNPLLYTSRLLRPLGGRIGSSSVSSKFTLGLLLGFMPCGLIYAALLKSMAGGTVIAGSMSMAAFGLGTAVSLLGAGLLSSAFGLKLGRWGSKLAAVSVLLIGLVLVGRGVMPMMASAKQQTEAESSMPACPLHPAGP